MNEIGEVKDFATGLLVAECAPGYAGSSYAKMQTVQKIWNGQRWIGIGEEGVGELLQALNPLATGGK